MHSLEWWYRLNLHRYILSVEERFQPLFSHLKRIIKMLSLTNQREHFYHDIFKPYFFEAR